MIPSEWPNIELWALTYLRPLMPGVTIVTEKPGGKLPDGSTDTRNAPPYRHLVVQWLPGVKTTEVTRQGLLNLESWATYSNGYYDIGQALADASRAAFLIESFPAGSPLVSADINTGPNRVRDTENTSMTFVETVMALEIYRAP